MEVTTILLALTTIVVIYWWFSRHDPRLPPCPCRPLPVVGHLLYLEKNFRPQIEKWRQQCGNVYSLYMGPSLVIIVSGFEAIKEVLVNNGNATSDRPPTIFDQITRSPKKGIGFTSGTVWKEQRSVTINILRALGVGRNVIAERVTEVAAALNQDLAELNGEPADISLIVITHVANVICSIIIGQRFDLQDGEFVKVLDYMRELIANLGGTQIANYFPFLLKVPGDLLNIKNLQNGADYIMKNFASKYVNKKSFEEYDENDLNNYVALYVHEMKKKNAKGQQSSLNGENLIRNVYDLFAAGMETTSNTLLWCILYIINYPDVQQKVYEEIQKEIGHQRTILIKDKNKLPYLNAVIVETQRIVSLAPLGVPHMCNETFSVGGYMIPRGAQIFPNLDSVLLSEKIWGKDCKSFRPERFINEQGKLQEPEEFIPFSMGKRVCVGESLARTELFLFFSNMMQRFQFMAPDSLSPPTLEPVIGFTAVPAPYKVRVLNRNADCDK